MSDSSTLRKTVPPTAFFLSNCFCASLISFLILRHLWSDLCDTPQLFLSIVSLQIHSIRSSKTFWMKFFCTSQIFFQPFSNPIVFLQSLSFPDYLQCFPQNVDPSTIFFSLQNEYFFPRYYFPMKKMSPAEKFSFPNVSLQSFFLLQIYFHSTSFLFGLYPPPWEYFSFYILI